MLESDEILLFSILVNDGILKRVNYSFFKIGTITFFPFYLFMLASSSLISYSIFTGLFFLIFDGVYYFLTTEDFTIFFMDFFTGFLAFFCDFYTFFTFLTF